MLRALVVIGLVSLVATRGGQLDRHDAAVFHHLHLSSPAPASLVGVYARLFQPEAIVRGVFWGIEGIQGRRFQLLISPLGQERQHDAPTALWHFGWGRVSLGESYAEHYLHEVNWRPPYASLEADFHVHLRSRNPRGAAGWYRDALGGDVDWPAGATAPASVDAVAALVRFDAVVLAIHGMSPGDPLVPSRAGGPADHLAFLVRDPQTVKVAGQLGPEAPAGNDAFALRGIPSTFIAGPDDIVVELLQAPRGPGFWHRP